MNNYDALASKILELVGGKGNVVQAEHCFTRLRILLLDKSKADLDAVKGLEGTKGAIFVGNQIQVVIGKDVSEVYEAFCKIGNFEVKKAIDENVDDVKPQKFTFKTFISDVMSGVSGCITPVVAGLICAGMISLIPAVIGPQMLGWITADSDLYRILSLAGSVPFYYFPVLVAYAASKKFNTNTVVAMIIAFVLVHPTMLDIVATGEAFSVYGIPMKLVTYTNQFLPMVLITYALSWIEKFVNKIVPDILKLVFVPVLEVLIMLPIALCILGPAASVIGVGLQKIFSFIYEYLGPVGMAIICGLWMFIVGGGMHHAILSVSTVALATGGADYVGMVAGSLIMFSLCGVAVGEMIRSKSAELKTFNASCLITCMVGGVVEPVLFGVGMKNKRTMIYTMIANAVGGALAWVFHIGYRFWGSYNVLILLSFANSEHPADLVYAIIVAVVCFLVGMCLVLFFGNTEDKKTNA